MKLNIFNFENLAQMLRRLEIVMGGSTPQKRVELPRNGVDVRDKNENGNGTFSEYSFNEHYLTIQQFTGI